MGEHAGMQSLRTITQDLLAAQQQLFRLQRLAFNCRWNPAKSSRYWSDWHHTIEMQAFEQFRYEHILAKLGAANDEQYATHGDAA